MIFLSDKGALFEKWSKNWYTTRCFWGSNRRMLSRRISSSGGTCWTRSWHIARPASAWRANMIGVTKRIIAFSDNGRYTVMYNPEIVSKSGMYQTEEGCLSLLGGPRPTTRYKTICVRYQNNSFTWKTASYTGFTAQIIQHEIDHCSGVLI